jgi:predicted O-methyltransferase YrrM
MFRGFERSTSVTGAFRQFAWLFRLPPVVAVFYVRAVAIAVRAGDRRSMGGSTRPRELAALLRIAKGRRAAVEIGTGTAWTSIALVLSDRGRHVATYDPLDYDERHRYLRLLGESGRRRLDLVAHSGDHPREDEGSPDLVFIDSSHERDETTRTFEVWAARLAPGGTIAFHDYGDPAWPGVKQAIEDLGLHGESHGYLFVWSAESQR